ncbi:MAG: tryptophanyl-tRNA synthetase [Thermosediminibacterales bacterium]|nr:tryptophanyl-tRNA synthetase [Thermosediminibacterales bacterium]
MVQKNLMSGMRPTGKLHLGNYLGALSNWVKLQEEYNCFYSIVDWHALTTGYEDTSEIKVNIKEMLIDWLSAGIDPEKSVVFVQSQVKETAELHLLFSMITPLSWLERNPTYKEQLKQLEGRNITNYGFLGYPVLQAADILICRGEVVPVGEDQLPHLELTREIARRFNYLYEPIFPEPKALLTEAKVLPGIDGRKMSKSYQNTIEMSDSPDEIRRKTKLMVTDPERIRKTDPGHPDICSVFAYNKLFIKEHIEDIRKECEKGKIGCVECKRRLAESIINEMRPIYEKRKELENKPSILEDILIDGSKRAQKVASETIKMVREAMKI